MADTIDAVNPDPPPPPSPQPPPPPPPGQQPPQQPLEPMTVIDTMPPAIPVDEPPPKEDGCFSKRSGLEKCLIILVIIILIIAFALIIVFLIHYFFFSPPEGTCLSDGCVKSASRLGVHMDGDLDPCNSFYKYACDGWSANQVLGPNQKKLDMATQMKVDHLMRLKGILDASIVAGEGQYSQKPKNFYHSCVNIDKLNERGTAPFLDVVSKVGKFPTLDGAWNTSDYSLQPMVTRLAEMSIMPLFDIQMEQSDFNADERRLTLTDGQLTLKKKKAYLGSGDNKELSGYKDWMVNVLVLLGADRQMAKDDVDDVVDFEIKLAERRRDDEDKEKYDPSFNPVRISKLMDDYPWLDWGLFAMNVGSGNPIRNNEVVDVREHSYMNKLEDLFDNTPARVQANFLMTRLLPLTSKLGSDFITEHDKYQKNVFGVESEARWKHCAKLTAEVYHDSVVRMFVENYFSPEDKEMVTQIKDDTVTVLRDRLVHNKWMTGDTRTRALEKLLALTIQVGYPDNLDASTSKNKDPFDDGFHKTEASANTYLENTVSLMEFDTSQKFTRRVKKDGWSVSPLSLDGRYNPEKNELILPAGMLQTPIYNTEFSSAMNYAGVGSIIGREIIHGFDQTGRMYDADLKFEDWWLQDDAQGFESQSACFLKQWGCYKWEGDSMNDNQALAENIAYNAGVLLGYEAYRSMITRRGTEQQRLPSLGMNNHQVFFLSYAQLWCAKYGAEARRDFIKTSSHPPFPYRVFGTLQNSKAFSKAFDCPIGTRMNPREKCTMW